MTATTPSASLRELLIEAAAERIINDGWATVTMALLASDVGVSRQTVYNEVGSKTDLAEALVMWELGHFLSAVNEGFDAEPDDLVAASERVCRNVFERAAGNELLRAAVSSQYGATSDLLPLLTINSEQLIDAAAAVIALRLDDYQHGLPPERLNRLVDTVVRLVLSHVMRPQGTPAEMADTIGWIVGRVVRRQR